MANTITTKNRVIELSAIDADWDGGKMNIASISFHPGAADDVLVIKEGSDSGPAIVRIKPFDVQGVEIDLKGMEYSPFLDVSDCNITAGGTVIIRQA